ncbi:helix-turn-helix domain-containing protein [Myroides sp. DF42-4-2]|uniref:AraC family transcriptional regulator n=1 Tax=Myroides sp. DF42-4-2 TaxID=2746726 RepID=UPI002576C9D8|nr:helix-turn-helix domain-containing protein [Myroides sp. DF42-4-2]MDM1408412.1 helix-turn-helix domain-containing protein [Myroides sp. DF42-4-2]
MSDQIYNYSIQDMLQLLEHDFQESGLYLDFRRNYSDNPLKHPYRNHNYTLIIVTQGTIEVQLDLISYQLAAHTLALIPPQTVIYFKQLSDDLHFVTLSFDKSFAIDHTQNEKSDFTLLAPHTVTHLGLSDEQLQTLLTLCELMDQKNKQKDSIPQYIEAIHHLFAVFLLELKAISVANNTDLKERTSRKEHLTLHFLETLQLHFKKEKNIRFYADELCVSERYLAKVVKEVTSKTIGELIDKAVILEAQLLLSNSSLSIGEIADVLNFNTTSFFGKFFKRNVGCSPRAYRYSLT